MTKTVDELYLYIIQDYNANNDSANGYSFSLLSHVRQNNIGKVITCSQSLAVPDSQGLTVPFARVCRE